MFLTGGFDVIYGRVQPCCGSLRGSRNCNGKSCHIQAMLIIRRHTGPESQDAAFSVK